MKLEMTNSNKMVVAMLALVALAVAFWLLVLSPKREEASKLATKAQQVQASLDQHRAEIAAAEEARDDFPAEYQRLVVLGKAVPGDDDTASLLVQVNEIAERSKVRFSTLALESEGGGEEAVAPESTATATSTPISPTEAAAATMPLGATVGAAGLGVMPYTLTFHGNFFAIADFIKGLDSMVKTKGEEVAVDGRLVTLDGFILEPAPNAGFPLLQATFAVTTYLTPPSEGVAAGASPESPAAATPVATTTGGTP